MDIERGIIKALFYDYLPNKMINLIISVEDGGFWKRLIEPLPDLMKLRMIHFDGKELKQALDEVGRECGHDYSESGEESWPILYLSRVADKMLDMAHHRPVVKFDELLRWRTLTLYVGEDLLTLSWLALKEKNAVDCRTDFVWEDILTIDQVHKNLLIGQKPLSDLHSHLGHSSDAFGIRWVYWMNNCWQQPMMAESRTWVCVAAIIRYYMFEIAIGGKCPSKQEVLTIIEARKGGETLLSLQGRIYKKVDRASNNSLIPNIDGIEHWDYAIQNSWKVDQDVLQSPYMMLAGERSVVYGFLKRVFNREPEATDFVKMFYLYTLIKVNCRKDFIQTNDLIGLSNYQDYEDNDEGITNLGEVKRRYAIQSALGPRRNNYLETRISLTYNTKKSRVDKSLADIRIEEPIFGKRKYERGKLLDKVRMVATHSKQKYTREGRLDYFQQIKKNIDEVVERTKSNHRLRKKEFCLVGMDFSSSDEYARPEAYAQLIRYARVRKYYRFTYHAGEDFYDLMDGLRTIEDILVLLKWDRHCRLGHVISLGIEPLSYYNERGWNVIATRQVLLDNLAWFLSKHSEYGFALAGETKRSISKKIKELYQEIGYAPAFDLNKYQQSMKLRSDHPSKGIKGEDMQLFVACALDPDKDLVALRSDAVVMDVFKEYYENPEIYDKGNEIVHWKMPRGVENGLSDIQRRLLSEIDNRKISIETCPTSNYMIGPFERYDKLPLYKFLDELQNGHVSVNTDDKGIIATSIEGEYALVAAALAKNGIPDNEIRRKLNTIIEGAKASRFSIR